MPMNLADTIEMAARRMESYVMRGMERHPQPLDCIMDHESLTALSVLVELGLAEAHLLRSRFDIPNQPEQGD